MTVRLTGFAGVLMALLMVSAAQAATIFAQTPTVDGSAVSDPSAAGTILYHADDFSLLAGDTVTNVTWQGLYSPGQTASIADNFTINFYADSASEPSGSPLQSFTIGNAVTRADSGSDLSGLDIYNYAADLGAGITLSGSTDYWISIFNNTALDLDDSWFWAKGSVGTAARSGDLADWTLVGSSEFSFTLGNVVPIPAAVWLFGSALGLLGWLKRRT